MIYTVVFFGIWITVAVIGIKTKNSATMSIGGGLLLAFISLAFLPMMFDEKKETKTIADNTQEITIPNETQTQNIKSSFCTVGYLNKTFDIDSNKVNSNEEDEIKVLCDTVRDVVKNQINNAKNTLENVCKSVDKKLIEIGGTSVGGMEKLKREFINGNEDASKLLDLANNCKSKSKKQQSLTDSFAKLSFYSYGDFQLDNTNCKGFVLENYYEAENNDTTDYQFYALPPCKREFTIQNPFHPVKNTNGSTLHQLLTQISYTGNKPEKIIYKGNEYSLLNTSENIQTQQANNQASQPANFKTEQDEFVIRYTDQILTSLRRGGLCDELKVWLLQISGNDAPAHIKERRLDKILEQAEKMRCLR